MWTWDASAPGAGGSGVCGNEGAARRAASAWMLAHGARTATAREVLLALGARTLQPRHEPTGTAFRARRGQDGRVTWAPARDAA
jgi:hypothetical protein